jgi:hypothetical protein
MEILVYLIWFSAAVAAFATSDLNMMESALVGLFAALAAIPLIVIIRLLLVDPVVDAGRSIVAIWMAVREGWRARR